MLRGSLPKAMRTASWSFATLGVVSLRQLPGKRQHIPDGIKVLKQRTGEVTTRLSKSLILVYQLIELFLCRRKQAYALGIDLQIAFHLLA